MPLSIAAGQQLLPLQARQPSQLSNLPGLHEEVLAAVQKLRSGTGALCVYGEPGVGKTHLLLWAAFAHGQWAPYLDCRAMQSVDDSVLDLSDAPFLCLDNIDAWAGTRLREEQLFCLFNERMSKGLPWLVSCAMPRPGWLLADWDSRLSAFTSYRLERPHESQLDPLIHSISARFGPPFNDALRRHLLRWETRNLGELSQQIEEFQHWLWQRHAAPTVVQWRLFRQQAHG